MNLITRRSFLERSLRAALGSAAAASLTIPPALRRAVADGSIPPGTRKLLFIFLRGGNDGLNTVIPWGDDAYNATTRPTLFVPAPDPASLVPGRAPDQPDLKRVIDLGNHFAGVHPALRDLVPAYNAGQLALVHRVAYAQQSRSHFDSQRYWENGVPRNNLVASGLFYRAVVDTGFSVGRQFPAVSVQSGNPISLRGSQALPNLGDPSRYDVLGVADAGADRAKLLSALTAGYGVPHPTKDNRDLLFNTGHGLADSIDVLKQIGITRNDFFDPDGTTHLFPIDAASNQAAVPAGSYGFFGNLKTALQILAGTDAIVAGTQLDGFDTHNVQGQITGGHANLLRTLGWSFHAARQFMLNHSTAMWQDTVVVTLSEFGRTSKENGSQGTDHAEASVMFLAGGRVKGGVYQCGNDSWTVGPAGSMFQVGGRYLRRTVDYRSVFGEVLRNHLGVTATQLQRVIPGYASEGVEHLAGGGTAADGTHIVGELGLI